MPRGNRYTEPGKMGNQGIKHDAPLITLYIKQSLHIPKLTNFVDKSLLVRKNYVTPSHAYNNKIQQT